MSKKEIKKAWYAYGVMSKRYFKLRKETEKLILINRQLINCNNAMIIAYEELKKRNKYLMYSNTQIKNQ